MAISKNKFENGQCRKKVKNERKPRLEEVCSFPFGFFSSFLSLCEKHIEVSPADSTDPDGQDANLSKLVIQGLLANLRLLLNLTHNNGELPW